MMPGVRSRYIYRLAVVAGYGAQRYGGGKKNAKTLYYKHLDRHVSDFDSSELNATLHQFVAFK
jgi:hypothetical protein